ncbi:MAG: SDR family oxidoreductase [FCB group bacterium]|nr:SDR family oxidoreductase [FCB group bacterium]
MEFKNKTVLITGAGQGIGAGIARHFMRETASVYLIDINSEPLNSWLTKSPSAAGIAEVFIGDVTQPEFIDSTVESILAKEGKIDILVNNAGIIRDNFITGISAEDWDNVLRVNLKGPFLLCRAVVPGMREKNYGKIVNIISRSWLGNPGQSNYAASKGGLVSLTRTLALELARFGINVNGVSPGFIDTPMTRGLSEKVRQHLLKLQPTGKMGQPEDIAEAVAFLASDRAQFITGQILHVDGGKSCGILSF